jgi:hypothetical protein
MSSSVSVKKAFNIFLYSFKSSDGGHFDLQIDIKNKNFLMDN